MPHHPYEFKGLLPSDAELGKQLEHDTLSRALWARLDAMRKTGEELVKEHREKAAHALISAGLTLIPSDHLRDNEFVVSRGVYEAAKRMCEDLGI